MTTNERYAYSDNYKSEQYKHDENRSDNSASPEKLFRFIDNGKDEAPQNKENYVQDQKASSPYMNQRDLRTSKGPDTSPSGKYKGAPGREYNISLKEKTNMVVNNNVPLSDNRNLAHSQTFGGMSQSEVNIQPAQSAVLQRSSTMGKSLFQLNRNDISISVTDPSRRGDMFNKHTYYSLQGSDKEGPFKTIRSHEDFLKIRVVLVKRWPGCYIPSVPPKRVLTKMVPEFLEGRRKEFEMFVQKITELPYIHYSREYQRFLRSTNLDADLEPFQKVSYDDIILRYKTTFKQSLQLQLTPEAEKKIQEFKTFLENIHNHFKKFKKVLKKTASARRTYYEQLSSFHEMMSGGYEKDVLRKMENNADSKSVFYNPDVAELKERVEGVKQASQMHSIEYLHAWIKAEAREIKAFLEAIDQKDLYENKRRKAFEQWNSTSNKLEKTLAGKSDLTAIFTGKNREERASILQGKVVGQDKEAKQLQTLYEMIALVLSHNEIDRFKERKSEQYHHVVHLAAEYELVNLRNLIDYWSTIVSLDPVKTSSLNGTSNNI